MTKSLLVPIISVFLLLEAAAPKAQSNDGASGVTAQQQPSLPVGEPTQLGPSGVGVSLAVETVKTTSLPGQFVYSAKFICGRIPHSLSDPQEPPLAFPLVPGTYRTAININNPNSAAVSFSKMALTTNPEGQPRGKAGTPVAESLAENEGLEVDCEDIEKLLTQSSGVDPFNNWNVDTVFQDPNGPPNATTFSLSVPAVIKQLVTYHFNNGQGDQPGPADTIRLLDQSGQTVLSFPAHGVASGVVPNANWEADGSQFIQPGSYTVVDSKKQTWSFNQQSLSAGFALVRGSPSFVGRAPFFKGFVVIRSPRELDVVGVYTVKNVITSQPNPPLATPQAQLPAPSPPAPGKPCFVNAGSIAVISPCMASPGESLTIVTSRALKSPFVSVVFKPYSLAGAAGGTPVQVEIAVSGGGTAAGSVYSVATGNPSELCVAAGGQAASWDAFPRDAFGQSQGNIGRVTIDCR
jgi:hypothetical protein